MIIFTKTLIMAMCFSTSVFADEPPIGESGNYVSEYNGNYHVSPFEPGTVGTRGSSIPNDNWDVTEEGAYDFKGSSQYNATLYTDYCIVGRDNYTVTVTNFSDKDLTVLVKTRLHTYSTNTFAAGTTSSYNVSGMKPETQIYLLFKGSGMSFSGNIE